MRRLLAAFFVGAALTAGVASASPAHAASTCVTLQYLMLIGGADNALSAVPAQPAAALTDLTQAEALAPSSGADLSPIVASLSATPPDIAGGKQRLDLLVQTLALPQGSVCHIDSQQAENDLHQVYASNVFADLDQNPPPSIFSRIGAVINWILTHLFDLLGSGGSIALGVIVLGGLLAFVIYRLRGVAGARRVTSAEEPASLGSDPDHEWQLALSAAQRGDYREAIRRSFRAALLEVADRRAHLDRAWTTREMLATLSTDADLLAVVAPAAASFDKAWYGGGPVDAADWDLARSRCEAVRRVARRAAATHQ
ncbi:MAG: DUF4129 domain-containing protein [Candidatus Dormibacteria bacterium]